MRNMSFAHTAEQFLAGKKTVTRRMGWRFLRPGDRFCAVRKARGLRREQIERLGVAEVVSIRRERLDKIDRADVAKEGFRDFTPQDFVAMFCHLNRGQHCRPSTVVTRIEFRRLEGVTWDK